MRIPESWHDKHGNASIYYERLADPAIEQVTIGEHQLTIMYETPHEGFSYGCSPADIHKMLSLAVDHVPCLPDIIAFRQPTRNQQQQQPVWGRYVYHAEFGDHKGSAIIVEAQELSAKLKWSKRMSLAGRDEFSRLVRDGHVFTETKRCFEATLSEDSIRGTILFRTILHELGHLADYHQKVDDEKTALAYDYGLARQLYFARPSSEREAFAHRFGEELRDALVKQGEVPFAPQE
ncbi:hypothetical protein [Aliiroseovarius halocynthiae]|uniref:Uncharacterized protein n=2 Tax=Aliiroseovarius halocynthiae TaxID=985055 RepID=A0A545SLK6_9RHOB|nr:hypothetical protein [Aliiroseovarius halocynthiae]TQV65867.1 hypothetical protein FIL88_15360 [Aliiroseovarius halocynthiae]